MTTRTECYDFIKSHSELKESINSKGKNFTNLPTNTLIEEIEAYKNKSIKTAKLSKGPKKESKTTETVVNNSDSFGRLLEVLKKKRLLLPKEIEYILG